MKYFVVKASASAVWMSSGESEREWREREHLGIVLSSRKLQHYFRDHCFLRKSRTPKWALLSLRVLWNPCGFLISVASIPASPTWNDPTLSQEFPFHSSPQSQSLMIVRIQNGKKTVRMCEEC